MIVRNLALLASDTARTKAYIQKMIHNDLIPEICVVYSDDLKKLEDECLNYKENVEESLYFDIKEPLLWTLNRNKVSYVTVDDKDINSEKMATCIEKLSQQYLVYSGYGGYILQKHLFHMGKKFIHVHAGILPQYRGSTTIYYSYLERKQFGATAIFLCEGIDEGEILSQKEFGLPDEPVNIDYIYEPYLRAQVLLDVVRKIADGCELGGNQQNSQNANTYFIIHPVLKHLALLGIEAEEKR